VGATLATIMQTTEKDYSIKPSTMYMFYNIMQQTNGCVVATFISMKVINN